MFRFSEKSGVHGFSGLHGTSGVYGSSGVYKVSGFNPLDLDPYLLFDAESSMIGTFENPTLDLDPATPSTLDVITATRSSVATRTLSDGTIALAEQDTVRVDYTQGAELTPTVYQYFSQTDFSNSYWSKRNSTITSGFSSPDGGNNAFKMVASQSDGDVFGSGVNTGNSHTKVVSVFAKAASATSKLRIQEQNYTGKRTEFDLNLGTITYSNSSGTSTIENIGDGWYRCAHVETYSTGFNTVAFALRSITADSLFLFGPQVEEGTTPTTFVPNTTGSPKFTGISATFAPRVPMILCEPSATNLLPYSEDFSNSAWTKQNDVAVASSSVEAPDGTTNAFKITGIESTEANTGLLENISVSASTTYIFSAYLKAVNPNDVGKKIRIRFKRIGGAFVSSNQQVVLSSEWTRHSASITMLSDNTGVDIMLTKDTSASSSERADECLIWGAQAEAGSVATSLIPTSGGDAAARTRAADNLVISGSAFSDFFNASEGTVYVESVLSSGSQEPFLFQISKDNGDSDRMLVFNDANNVNALVDTSGSRVVFQALGSRPSAGALSRTAFSYATNNIKASADGASVATDTSAALPTGINKLFLSSRVGQSEIYKLNGHIKRLIYWPYHSDSL